MSLGYNLIKSIPGHGEAFSWRYGVNILQGMVFRQFLFLFHKFLTQTMVLLETRWQLTVACMVCPFWKWKNNYKNANIPHTTGGRNDKIEMWWTYLKEPQLVWNYTGLLTKRNIIKEVAHSTCLNGQSQSISIRAYLKIHFI